MTPWRWLRSLFAAPESLYEQRLAAWFPEAYDERKAGRAQRVTCGGATVGRAPDGSHGAAPELKMVPGRSTVMDANPIPTVQRAIECRALLDTALAVAQQHPECMPVFIHTHQADQDGQEIRN